MSVKPEFGAFLICERIEGLMLIEMRGPGDAGGPAFDYRVVADALRQARGQWVCLTFTGVESGMLQELAADAKRSFARLSEGLANAVFAGAAAEDQAEQAIEPTAFEMRLESQSLYLRWRGAEEGGLPAPEPAVGSESVKPGGVEAVNLP